jgi:triacylglycerol esterase/lipase EstA (alpha/beta hydrolase family)
MSQNRILTFGYDANVVSLTGRASLNSLFEHSINLLNELSRKRKDAVSLKQCLNNRFPLISIQRDRPIVFVAHSLGGLIVKDVSYSNHFPVSYFRPDGLPSQALDRSERVQNSQPHLAHVFSATRGVIFLGTPHRGSGMASFARVVASVTQVVLRNTNSRLIRDLERDSSTLDRIRDNFSQILDKRTLSVWTFVEELGLPGTGKVYMSLVRIPVPLDAQFF